MTSESNESSAVESDPDCESESGDSEGVCDDCGRGFDPRRGDYPALVRTGLCRGCVDSHVDCNCSDPAEYISDEEELERVYKESLAHRCPCMSASMPTPGWP